jgi:hypothetical protein
VAKIVIRPLSAEELGYRDRFYTPHIVEEEDEFI